MSLSTLCVLKISQGKVKTRKSQRREERKGGRKDGRSSQADCFIKRGQMWHLKGKVSQKHGSENVNHLFNMY